MIVIPRKKAAEPREKEIDPDQPSTSGQRSNERHHEKETDSDHQEQPKFLRPIRTCLFCQMSNHRASQCQLRTEVKIQIILGSQRCLQCLEQWHLRAECEGEKCRKCKGPHHTFLCCQTNDDFLKHALDWDPREGQIEMDQKELEMCGQFYECELKRGLGVYGAYQAMFRNYRAMFIQAADAHSRVRHLSTALKAIRHHIGQVTSEIWENAFDLGIPEEKDRALDELKRIKPSIPRPGN